MTIFKSIELSQILVRQLSHKTQTEADKRLLSSLTVELKNISVLAMKLTEGASDPPSFKPELKSGCYIFAGEKGFFCPNCYDNLANKVPTKRLNSKLRVCPVCRASIH